MERLENTYHSVEVHDFIPFSSILSSAQRVKLSESWPKFKFFDFDETLKNLREGRKKVPRIKKM
jgi:hypothetical protein